MNYISHHEVGVQYNPSASPDFLFGTIISDLARMAGARRSIMDITNEELLAGVRLHNLTNKPAFDEQPAIIKLEEDIRTSFDEFLPWKQARQASRAGKDLLFDGIRFENPRVLDVLHETLGRVIAGEVSLEGIDCTPTLFEVVKMIHSKGPPRYDDIEVVTKRLHTTLSRTRTPLDLSDFDRVANVLERHQQVVFEIGPAAMQRTVEVLREIDPPA